MNDPAFALTAASNYHRAMNKPKRRRLPSLFRGIGVRQVRLASGAVLFAYLVSHFLNHALGNVSMDALASGVYYHVLFWQFPPIAAVFYGSTLVHAALGLWALYDRRHLHWKTIEPVQIVFGLSIPMLLIGHVVAVRAGQALFAHQKLYPQVFYAYWVYAPEQKWRMLLVTLVAWIHGCIGLYFWLRMKPFYRWAAPYLLGLAILAPTLAMLGLYQGGRQVVEASSSREWRAENLSRARTGTASEESTLNQIGDRIMIGYLALIAIVLASRGARALYERRAGTIRLAYGNDRMIRVPRGLSVLEASRRNNIPHASICGGRARCSTCRIRVVDGLDALPAPSKREAFVLHRVGAGADPAVRLACQLRPSTDLSFVQIFPPRITTAAMRAGPAVRIGEERYLVSMFVDMRGSTKLAETRLPFDTVFIVNRFLGAVSRAVIAAGGEPNQFVGDGQLALFGLAATPREACRQAIRAAAMIAVNVAELNRFLGHDLRDPIKFGIGIHGGEVIIGDIGYGNHMVFTALGDPVNVAARLQDMTKTLACETVLSDAVRQMAGLPHDALPVQQVAIRGRVEEMTVCVVTRTGELAALTDQAAMAAPAATALTEV